MNSLGHLSTLIQKYQIKQIALGLIKQTVTLFVPKDQLADFIVHFSAATQSSVPRNFAIHTRIPDIWISHESRGGSCPESVMFFDPVIDKKTGELLGQNITVPFDGTLSDFSQFPGIEHSIVIKDLKDWLCRTFQIDENYETVYRPKGARFNLTSEPEVSRPEYLVSLINSAFKHNQTLFYSHYEFSLSEELQDWFLTFNF